MVGQGRIARIARQLPPSFGDFVFLWNHGSPTCSCQLFNFLDELMAGFCGDSLDDGPFSYWVPRSEEISNDKVVELGMVATKIHRRCLTCWHNGVVVGNF